MARSDLPSRLTALLMLLSSVLSQSPKDPVKDFCRRFSHQTAVINRRLYIDGGYVNANPLSQNPRAVENPHLLVQNLDVLENGMPALSANLSKNATVPSVSGGMLWADEVNQVLYLFGGEYTLVPEYFSLWAYDVPMNQWDVTERSTTSSAVEGVAWGAGTTVNGRAEGYYYGGYLNNKTTPGWNAPPWATSSLIKYDMIGNRWTNNTGPDATGRAEGVMVSIPAANQGLLVYFGGVSFPYDNASEVASPMSTIFLYDIAEGKWYRQEATGQIPENRRKFCAGATWAQDQSSYNIYLYGGAGFAENATGFDDVYILTLPSFTWIKWYPTEPGPGHPHHSLSCNVIDNAQMLIIGGDFPLTDACDAPDVVGTHNLDLGKNNPKQAKWELFNPDLRTYNVPSEIVAVVGGSSTGGATVTAPASGWDHRDLPVYFQQQATYPSRTPTRVPQTTESTPGPRGNDPNGNGPSGKSKGAIIGGAVGGAVAALMLLGIAIFFWIRRRRRHGGKHGPGTAQSRLGHQSELDVSTNPASQSMPSPLSHSANLPSYAEQKPAPPSTMTMMHPFGAGQSSSFADQPFTVTPPPMASAGSQHLRSEPPTPPTLHPNSFAPHHQSPSYQHPAHSPPTQQQPYFPPPPIRGHEIERAPSTPSLQSAPTVEMPATTSPRPFKKTWNDPKP